MITKETLIALTRSWAIGAVLLVFFLVGLFMVIAPFLEGLVWGVILVFMTWPIYHWLHVKCGIREVVASLCITVGAGVIFLLALVPMTTEIVRELYSISKEANLDSLRSSEKLFSIPLLDVAVRKLHIDDASRLLLETLGTLSLDFTGRAAQLFLKSLTNIGMMIFSSYFLFRYGSRLLRELLIVLSHFSNLNWERIFKLTGGTIRGVVYGALTTAIAQGIIAGIGFYLTTAPIPVLLGFATMFMSFIPFGAPIIYIPTSLYLLLGVGNWFAGVGLLIWGALIVSTVDNILRPLFISQTMKLPLLSVFIGVLGGILAFGLIGLFIGPVLVALAHAAWKEIVDYSTRKDSIQTAALSDI